MEKFPGNSLDPNSQPWVREVERRVRGLETARSADLSKQSNSAAGVIATLGKLSDQIAALTEAQARLDTVVGDLAAQQASLAAQVARIDSLINSQVVTGYAPTAVAGPWSIGTTYGTKAMTSIPVPTGYTRAVIYASGSASLVNNHTGNAILFGYIDIAGEGGSHQTCYVSNGTYRAPSVVTPVHSRSMSGLAGGSITIGLVAAFGGVSGAIDPDLTRAQVSGFAIFLR